MFSNLSERFKKIFSPIYERGRLTDYNIDSVLREIKISLFESDVSLPVVKKIIEEVKTKSLEKRIKKSLSPGKDLISIIKNEIKMRLGEKNTKLNLSAKKSIILMLGIQGSGKTTTTVKLAKMLKISRNKNPIVVSCDTYRAGAREQLYKFSKSSEISCLSYDCENPIEIVKRSLNFIQNNKNKHDVLIIDTAGRMHTNSIMMEEIIAIQDHSLPIETLLVIDSMMGQNAINMINSFSSKIRLTGVILSKIDSDSRGGAALSITDMSKKPIKFIGTGETSNSLEEFCPEQIVNNIIGTMDIGNIVQQVEKNTRGFNLKSSLQSRTMKTQTFTLDDFKNYLIKMQKVGNIASLIGKIFTNGQKFDEQILLDMKIIINSMTLEERHNPSIIKSSRKKRIAYGSGTSIQSINHLLKTFVQSKKMMKSLNKKGAMSSIMKRINLGKHGFK